MDHIAAHDLAAVGEIRRFDRCRRDDTLRQVEQNALHRWISTEHGGEYRVMSATDAANINTLAK
jgi:hypothetical protein